MNLCKVPKVIDQALERFSVHSSDRASLSSKQPGHWERPAREGAVVGIGWWVAIACQALIFVLMLLTKNRMLLDEQLEREYGSDT
jgi:hypothetical protein